MNALTRARLELLAAAILFSTGGAAIKACTLSSWQVAAFRSGIAALALAVMLPHSRRGWTWRVPVVGLAYALSLTLFVIATKLTTAANTIFLESTAPLYISALAPWLLGERTHRRDLIFMGVFALGLGLLVFSGDVASASAPDPARGNLFAALTGLTWAFALIGLRWISVPPVAGGGAAAAVLCGNIMACVFCLPFALPAPLTPAFNWIVIAYLGIVQVALAYVFLTRAVAQVPALEASLLLLLEPVLNPVWAWLAHGEHPGAWSIVGGLLVLTATAAKSFASRRPRAVPHPK